jgi:lipopolysaccharide export system permease protein
VLTIIDRYVLKQVLTPLGASLSIGLCMLLAERLVRLLDKTLGKNNSVGAVFELLAYLVPHYLGTAVPAALFIGLLFGFSKLSKSNELDAMLSAGIGLHRLAWPVFLLALLFTLASTFIFGWLQPMTRYAYRSLIFDITSVDAFYLAEEGVFMETGSRTFILDKLDRSNNTFKRIFLFDYHGDKGAETLTASDGVLIPLPGQVRPVLRLNNGHRLLVQNWPNDLKGAEPDTAGVAEFTTTDTPLGKVSKDLFRPRGNDAQELFITELVNGGDGKFKEVSTDEFRAEFHRRIVSILSMLLLPFLAMPFAIGRARSPRAYRIAIALALLVAYYEIIQQGALATRTSGISPWLTQWLPLGLLAAFSFWRFYVASFKLGGEGLDRWLMPMQEFTSRLITRVLALFGVRRSEA